MLRSLTRRSSLAWVALAALIIVLVIAARKFVVTRDDLSSRREQVAQAWPELDAAISDRAAMLQDVVATLQPGSRKAVPGAGKVATMMIKAHESLASALTAEEKMRANTRLDNVIGRFMILADDEPSLQENKDVATLELQLDAAENRILKARQKYNQVLHDYNVQLQQFPQNAVALVSGFRYNDAYFTTNVAARLTAGASQTKF